MGLKVRVRRWLDVNQWLVLDAMRGGVVGISKRSR